MPYLINTTSNPNVLRLEVSKFLYRAGTNVALYNATKHPKYSKFRDNLEAAIQQQISVFVDEAKISEIGFDTTPSLEIVNKYFPSLDTVYPKGREGIDAVYIWAGTQGGQAALDKLGIGKVRKAIEATFVLRNLEMISRLLNGANLMIKSVDDTTRQWIAETIAAGKSEFFTNDEVARLLVEGGRDISKFRAKLIAETEVASAMSVIERQTYKYNNVRQMKWEVSTDTEVCPICADNSGKVVGVDATFPSGDTEPPAHPRCRCYLEPVFDNDFLSREGDFFTGGVFPPSKQPINWERESRRRRHHGRRN